MASYKSYAHNFSHKTPSPPAPHSIDVSLNSPVTALCLSRVILTHCRSYSCSALPSSCTVPHRNACCLVLSHARPVRFVSISPSNPMIPVTHPNSPTLNRQLHFPPFKETQILNSHHIPKSSSLSPPSVYFQPARFPLLFRLLFLRGTVCSLASPRTLRRGVHIRSESHSYLHTGYTCILYQHSFVP